MVCALKKCELWLTQHQNRKQDQAKRNLVSDHHPLLATGYLWVVCSDSYICKTHCHPTCTTDLRTKSWQTTAGLSKHEGWMYCSICTVFKGRTSFRIGESDNGIKWKPSLAERQSLVVIQPRTRHQEVQGPAETGQKWNYLFLAIVWCWRLRKWMANRWFIHPSFTRRVW